MKLPIKLTDEELDKCSYFIIVSIFVVFVVFSVKQYEKLNLEYEKYCEEQGFDGVEYNDGVFCYINVPNKYENVTTRVYSTNIATINLEK